MHYSVQPPSPAAAVSTAASAAIYDAFVPSLNRNTYDGVAAAAIFEAASRCDDDVSAIGVGELSGLQAQLRTNLAELVPRIREL